MSSLREEKGRVLEEILECERQIVLWEKKLALEKETQEALDPTVGESEIKGMEKDIHRMKLRHEAVSREQERLVAEMERAIEKREVIAMKHKSSTSLTTAAAATAGKTLLGASAGARGGAGGGGGGGAGGPGAAAATRLGLRHRATTLRKEIEARSGAAADVEAAVADKEAAAQEMLAAVTEHAAAVAELEGRAASKQRAINAALYEKQKAVEAASLLGRMLQRLEELETGRLPPLTTDEALHAVDRLRDAEGARAKVRALTVHLAAAHPELLDVLDRVAQLIDIAPTL